MELVGEFTMVKKFLIIGLGNIGKRHLKNLIALGYNVDIVDENMGQAFEYAIENKFECSIAKKIEFLISEESLSEKYSGILICTPTSLRYNIIKDLKGFKYPIFVEKPLASTYEEAKKIYNFAKKNKMKIFMGFPWRYHPCIQFVKSNLNKIGKIYSASSIGGSYLPSWHPEQDYRKSYSAKKNGGGITIDATHEFDLLLWLLGDYKTKKFIKDNNSELDIESDDYCNAYIKHKNGASSAVIADYYRRQRRRELEIVGSKGTILADLISGTVFVNNSADYLLEDDYDLNKMYLNQILDFTKGKGVSLEDGLRVCKLLGE